MRPSRFSIRRRGAPCSALDTHLARLALFPPLSRTEEVRLARLAIAGDATARDQLVTAQLRFVVQMASKYAVTGLPLEDLIAQGNLGLVRAVDRFDPERGLKFISFAVWYIRQALNTYVAGQRFPVYVPTNMAARFAQVRRQLATRRVDGATPSMSQTARPISAEHLAHVLTLHQPVVRLDGQVTTTDDDAPTWNERLADPNLPDPHDRLDDERERAWVAAAWRRLSLREQGVVRAAFGLPPHGDGPQSLVTIAATMGISRERVRQIRDQALKVLRQEVQREAQEEARRRSIGVWHAVAERASRLVPTG